MEQAETADNLTSINGTENLDGIRLLEALATATRLDSLPSKTKVSWGRG